VAVSVHPGFTFYGAVTFDPWTTSLQRRENRILTESSDQRSIRVNKGIPRQPSASYALRPSADLRGNSRGGGNKILDLAPVLVDDDHEHDHREFFEYSK